MALTDRFNHLKQPPVGAVLPGIFCDVHGTLVGPDNPALVRYLNAEYAAGTPVQLVSGQPDDAKQDVAHLGLHPGLVAGLQPKDRYFFQTVEVLIDDAPPPTLFSVIHLDPHDQDVRNFMQQENGKTAAGPTPKPLTPP